MRFLIGGLIVSAFAVLGDLFKPKTFAGLFGAAPSVALATLILTVAQKGKIYAAIESRSMIAGAVAFFLYALCVMRVTARYRLSGKQAAVLSLPVWFIVAFGLWMLGRTLI